MCPTWKSGDAYCDEREGATVCVYGVADLREDFRPLWTHLKGDT